MCFFFTGAPFVCRGKFSLGTKVFARFENGHICAGRGKDEEGRKFRNASNNSYTLYRCIERTAPVKKLKTLFVEDLTLRMESRIFLSEALTPP